MECSLCSLSRVSPVFLPFLPIGAMNSTKTQEVLEQENDELVDSLRHKVSALKSVSFVPMVTYFPRGRDCVGNTSIPGKLICASCTLPSCAYVCGQSLLASKDLHGQSKLFWRSQDNFNGLLLEYCISLSRSPGIYFFPEVF